MRPPFETPKPTGLDHRIVKLEWPSGAAPSSNVASAARDSRYSVIRRICRELGIINVLTAHHRDDQVRRPLGDLAVVSGRNFVSRRTERPHAITTDPPPGGPPRHAQIETFVERLVSGSGLNGLACMAPVSLSYGAQLHPLRIVRPLLPVGKVGKTLLSKSFSGLT